MNMSFNPATDVSSTEEQAAASRWECLRRNTEFRAVADRWMSDASCRGKMIEDDPRPRCALGWMLNPDEACHLAKDLAKIGKLKLDERFNFGPFQQQFKATRLKGSLSFESLLDCFVLTPDRRHKSQLSYEHNWLQAPSGFRKQFLIACSGGKDFHVHSGEVLRNQVCWVVNRLLVCASAAEAQSIGRMLFEKFYDLREYSDKLLVLDVGDKVYPRWRVNELLEQVRHQIPTMTGHSEEKRSWYGTTENWRWYLEWESNGHNVRETANSYVKEKSPKQTATKSIAARERDARKTIKDHVDVIERWIKQTDPAR